MWIFHGTLLNAHFEKIPTSKPHSSYMITEIFTCPKHNFTRLGRVDRWLSRTLSLAPGTFEWKYQVNYWDCEITLVSSPGYNELQTWIFNILLLSVISILTDKMANVVSYDVMALYSISQEICTRFLLCCALLWLYIDWFSHIHQAYFTGTVAI